MQTKLLEIQNITKRHHQKGLTPIDALKGVSLDLYTNEIIALLGPNGAGKSTLSSIIATLQPPTSGDVLFKGKSIYNNLIDYRLNLGFCPQRPNLDDSLTLEQNLRFAGRFYGMAEDAIDARLTKLVHEFELIQYLDRTSNVLSGGYKQRFMIARSIMHSPALVILDEPTVGLDPHVRRQLWETIKDLKRHGVTVIITTHYLDEAEELADRVCIIDKGLIRLVDTPQKLLNDFKKENLEDVFLTLMNEEDAQ